MEQNQHSSEKCRRCTWSSPRSSAAEPADRRLQNLHSATQVVTSRMTCASSQSQTREKSVHFCRCLRRRRILLKNWSWRHREATGCCPVTWEFDVHNNTLLQRTSECDRTTHNLTLKPDWDHNADIEQTSSLINKGIGEAKLYLKEIVTYHDPPSTGVTCLERSRLSSNSDNAESRDAKMDFKTSQLHSVSSVSSIRPSPVDPHTCSVSTTPATTRRKLGQLLLRCSEELGAGIIRRAESVVGRVVGLCFRLSGDADSTRARSMTFHRWLTVVLVCVMVLPIPSTAAPGFPWQASGENMAEPGYKNSFYETLPPKAEYESVIICLLAVSAFIGLIVWVLKTNFEERQQKRMRREASIRERTSSVAFLKT